MRGLDGDDSERAQHPAAPGPGDRAQEEDEPVPYDVMDPPGPEGDPESLAYDAGIPSQEDLDRAVLRQHLAELRSSYATAKLKLAVAKAQIKGVSESTPAVTVEVGQLRRLIGVVEVALEGDGLPDPVVSDVIELADHMPDGPTPA